MTTSHSRRALAAALASVPAAAMLAAGPADAQGALPEPRDQPGKIMLTVFLRHDETKTVDEDQRAPPADRLVPEISARRRGGGRLVRDDGHRPGGDPAPAAEQKLRETNRIIESAAWGGLSHRVLPDLRFPALIGNNRRSRRGERWGVGRKAGAFSP